MKDNIDQINQDIEIIQEDVHKLQQTVEAISNKPERYMQLYRPVTESDNSAIKSVLDFPITANLFGASGATAANYGIFFIADRPCEVTSVKLRYTTASTSGTVQIEKLNGTDALDGGEVILTAAISTAATANTTYSGTLLSTVAKTLSPGDALALVDAGTLTNLVGLCVSVTVKYR
jgi:hypothetical protein